ncbi:MAG: hypothetical protein KJ726_08520, partial [Verrucomicrobia bacterium]|nr:hypothetical protein [Verrucomicrobiota bacterium]
YRSVDGDNWELVIVFPGIDRVNVITEGAAGAMYVGTSGLGDVHTLWTPTDGRFFRVMGPAESTIVGWTKAGMLTWTNTDEVLDVPVLIEACTDLVASNWGAYIQAACTARVNAAQIYHPQ